MVQSLQLQSQQSRGDFHHFVHLKDTLPIYFFSASKDHDLHSKINKTRVGKKGIVFLNLLTPQQ